MSEGPVNGKLRRILLTYCACLESQYVGSVQFSGGWGVVKETFDGTVAPDGVMLRIAERSFFAFSDRFADPVGLGIEVGGDPFAITGRWSATFSAEVLPDAKKSIFTEG